MAASLQGFLNAILPATVDFNLDANDWKNTPLATGKPSYGNIVPINNPTPYPIASSFDAWCIRPDIDISVGGPYSANVYSGLNPLPSGITAPTADPKLINEVEWIFNNVTTQANITGGSSGGYTYGGNFYSIGTTQLAIWELAYGAGANNPAFTQYLPAYDQGLADSLAALAKTNGSNFTPTWGQSAAVVLSPGGVNPNYQPFVVDVKTPDALGSACFEAPTYCGSKDSSAEAEFTIIKDAIVVTVTDNVKNPSKDSQLISGINFSIGSSSYGSSYNWSGCGSYTPVASANNGYISTISAGGAHTAGVSDPLTSWAASQKGNSFKVNSTDSKEWIIGPDNNGLYSNAGSSILKHNPVTLGSATFVIAAPGVGASTEISNVSFQFGDTSSCFSGGGLVSGVPCYDNSQNGYGCGGYSIAPGCFS